MPARGGSVEIPAKNLRQMLGKPLIAHTIEPALKSEKLSDFCVSTDNAYIEEIAKSFGVKNTVRRPDVLATSDAPIVPVIRHAIEDYERSKKVRVDAAVVLFPTLPLRTKEDIDGAISAFLDAQPANSLTTVHSVDPRLPYYLCRSNGSRVRSIRGAWPKKPNRQQFKPLYLLDGAVEISARNQVFSSDTLQEYQPVYFEITNDHAMDIDDEGDWRLVEAMMQVRKHRSRSGKTDLSNSKMDKEQEGSKL